MMLGITNKVKIPLDKPLSRVVIPVKQNDKNSRRISFTLTQNGTVYDIENVRVAAVRGTKPDGNIIYNDCLIIDNEIIYDITSQTISAAGKVSCELVLLGQDLSELASADFIIEVYPQIFDDHVIESCNEYNVLESCISECVEEVARATASADRAEEAALSVEGSIGNITKQISNISSNIDELSEDISDLQTEDRSIYGTLEYDSGVLKLVTSLKNIPNIPYKCYGFTDKDIILNGVRDFLINGISVVAGVITTINNVYKNNIVEISIYPDQGMPRAKIIGTRDRWGASVEYEVTNLKNISSKILSEPRSVYATLNCLTDGGMTLTLKNQLGRDFVIGDEIVVLSCDDFEISSNRIYIGDDTYYLDTMSLSLPINVMEGDVFILKCIAATTRTKIFSIVKDPTVNDIKSDVSTNASEISNIKNNHINNNRIHVTETQKKLWDAGYDSLTKKKISGVIEYSEENRVLNLISSFNKNKINLGAEYLLGNRYVCYGYTDKNITITIPYPGRFSINGVRQGVFSIYLNNSCQTSVEISANSIITMAIEYEETVTAIITDIDCFNMDSYIEYELSKLKNDYNEVFTYVSDGKALIASAITDRGVETANDATFATMKENIEMISGGSTIVKLKESYSIAHNVTDNSSVITEQLSNIALSYNINVTESCELSVTESEG